MLKEVFILLDENELWQSGENIEDERFVREFVLNKADTFMVQIGEVGQNLEKFNEFLTLVKDDLIKIDGRNYYFNLSEKIKDYLNEATLFFSCNMDYFPHGYFYGFTNPAFFQGEKLLMKMNSYSMNFTFIVPEEEVSTFKDHKLKIFNISNV